jgi:hypothetical protein
MSLNNQPQKGFKDNKNKKGPKPELPPRKNQKNQSKVKPELPPRKNKNKSIEQDFFSNMNSIANDNGLYFTIQSGNDKGTEYYTSSTNSNDKGSEGYKIYSLDWR